MRRIIAWVLLAALLLCGCSAGGGKRLEEWTVPEIETAPTVAPTARPAGGGGLQPELYVWNEALSFNMSDPGVTVETTAQICSHGESVALFGGRFLPDTIFAESYVGYSKQYLRQTEHQILIDASGALAENSYVEYQYVPADWNEKNGITVLAELCGYDKVMSICSDRQYPHIAYAQGAAPALSAYYLDEFVLAKLGTVRYAQWMVLPSAYFSYADRVIQEAEDSGTEPEIQRQVLLTFYCGSDIEDQQFVAAVRAIAQYAVTTRTLPSAVKRTPAPGEKGAA